MQNRAHYDGLFSLHALALLYEATVAHFNLLTKHMMAHPQSHNTAKEVNETFA